jgi:hypothetical protein
MITLESSTVDFGEIPTSHLALIADKVVYDFVSLCFLEESLRPTASQLLKHSFFTPDTERDNLPVGKFLKFIL